MSGPKLRPPKPKPVADDAAMMRMAASLQALVGDGWDNKNYGVAVSGGPDSMALLDMMAGTLPDRVRAATVDHGLRTGSADEADMVASWCDERQIPHRILTPETPIEGSIQAAARTVRYRLLDVWRAEEALDFILTAHHADDQLETMIMRLNRSSGVGGLASVRSRQGHVLRPLLQWSRSDLQNWVMQRDIPFVIDPSNSDPRFDRARLRQSLAAQNILDAAAVARSATWLDQADQALDWMVDRTIATWPDADDTAIIRNDHYPEELLRRIVERRLRAHQPMLELRGVALDSVVRAMKDGRRAMLGQLLIDPQPSPDGSVWRISAAPRRKQGAK